MKRLALFAIAIALVACGSSSDGSSAGAPSSSTSPDTNDAGASNESSSDASAPSDGSPSSNADATADAAPPPKDLAHTDGSVATGWYCGKNTALSAHASGWAVPSLDDPNNLFHVDQTTNVVSIVGFCTGGCAVASGGHDHCTAPNGAPIAGKECFAGAGKYCGHVLGIEARSYPVVANHEGLFDCDATNDVSQTTNCDCQVAPGESDECVPAGGGRKLYIAYEAGSQTCVPELTDFWHCLLERSNVADFQRAYGTGYTLAWGGIAQIPASCGTDYQCAVTNGHFAVNAFDVVLIVKAGGVGGQNNWDPIVSVGGKNVHIHGGFIGDGNGSCDMQTAYSMHEVYEATSDPGSADCCDGEVPYTPSGASGCLAWNSGASIACRKWGPTSCGGDGSYGLARIQCGANSYLYQRISPADDEYGFTKNQCLPLAITH
jgi:hypothetical protein